MTTIDLTMDRGSSIKIPDHELLRMIGKGGYGEVWLARNIMGTYRAIKIIRRNEFDSHSPFDREFAGIKKFEPISRTHSGFVDILQIGRNDSEGFLYYVMEAADDLSCGQSIDPDSYIPRTLGKALGQVKRFPVDQCVQMGLALCQALETLHRHGLVHRDIKPSNIVFINGVPKLADIGLVTESNNSLSFVGTEGFIPPEGPGSERADIFSLGKALYEIASGRDRLDFPALPTDLSEFKDGEQFLELNECLIRACRLDPQRRYASAREMYEDLAFLASGKSLRRLRVLERRWENAKRTVVLTGGLAVLAAAIAWPIIRERQHAEEIRERQIGVRSTAGVIKMDQGDMAGALREFSEIYRLQASDKKRFLANQTRVASIIANMPKLTQMAFFKNRINAVELSPDGKRLLVVEYKTGTRLIDMASGSDIFPAVQSKLVEQASLSPDGKLAVIADQTGAAIVWNLITGQTTTLEHPLNVVCARFSPSGKLIATGCNDAIVRIWNSATLKLVMELSGHENNVRSVTFSPDETLLASTGNDFTARIWNVRSGKLIVNPMRHPSWVVDASFSPDQTSLVTACQDGLAHLWEVESGKELPSRMHHDDVVTRVGFSPDGSMIFTASNDATICLWDGKTTLPIPRNHVLRHSAGVLSAGFLPNGHQIITGCLDGSVRTWDLAGAELEPDLIEGVVNSDGSLSAAIVGNSVRVQKVTEPDSRPVDHPVDGKVLALSISPRGSALAALVVSPVKKVSIQIWKPIDSDLAAEIPAPINRLKTLEFSPDDSLLVATWEANGIQQLRAYDSVSGAEWTFPHSEGADSAIAFDPRGKAVAFGNEGNVAVYENFSSTPKNGQFAVDGNVRHLAFSSDGKRILVCQNDSAINPKSALILDSETGQRIGPQYWHRDGVLDGAFSPDASRIITGGEDRELIVWNVGSPAESLPPMNHHHQVRGVAFSEDGRWIGSVAANRTTRLWDSETGFPITPPLNCESNQTQIILLPDHRRFVTMQTPIRSWVWTLPNFDLLPEDAVALGHLLNADIRTSGPMNTTQSSAAWNNLTKKFPNLFRADQKQIRYWHERQLRYADANGLPLASAFHRQRIESLSQKLKDDEPQAFVGDSSSSSH